MSQNKLFDQCGGIVPCHGHKLAALVDVHEGHMHFGQNGHSAGIGFRNIHLDLTQPVNSCVGGAALHDQAAVNICLT